MNLIPDSVLWARQKLCGSDRFRQPCKPGGKRHKGHNVGWAPAPVLTLLWQSQIQHINGSWTALSANGLLHNTTRSHPAICTSPLVLLLFLSSFLYTLCDLPALGYIFENLQQAIFLLLFPKVYALVNLSKQTPPTRENPLSNKKENRSACFCELQCIQYSGQALAHKPVPCQVNVTWATVRLTKYTSMPTNHA